MAHYALLDINNTVVQTITGIDETELIEGLNPEIWYGNFHNMKCKRTSYNGNIRKHYAGIGYTYDERLDAFIPPKQYPSWVLNEVDCVWEAPVPFPADGNGPYKWSEDVQNWVK